MSGPKCRILEAMEVHACIDFYLRNLAFDHEYFNCFRKLLTTGCLDFSDKTDRQKSLPIIVPITYTYASHMALTITIDKKM